MSSPSVFNDVVLRENVAVSYVTGVFYQRECLEDVKVSLHIVQSRHFLREIKFTLSGYI